MPNDLLVPNGLSPERKWHLYEKTQEFCPHEVQDLVCPKPTVSKP